MLRASAARRGRDDDCSQVERLPKAGPLPSWRRSCRTRVPMGSRRRPKRRGRGHAVGRVAARHRSSTAARRCAVFRPWPRPRADPALSRRAGKQPLNHRGNFLHGVLPSRFPSRFGGARPLARWAFRCRPNSERTYRMSAEASVREVCGKNRRAIAESARNRPESVADKAIEGNRSYVATQVSILTLEQQQ